MQILSGVEQYNNEYWNYAQKRIKKNSDKKYLNGFYQFLLSDGQRSFSGAYAYLGHVIGFVNYENIVDPKTINLDNFSEYLNVAYQGRSSSHQICVFSALKEFSKYLIANGYVEKDYMQFFKRPTPVETVEMLEKREKAYMTTDEIDQYISNVRNSDKREEWKARDMAIVLILLNSGIRCAALQKLDLDNVNFDDNSITVLEKRKKSKKVYLTEKTMGTLSEWLEYRNELLVDNNECALFISNHKKRITRKTIYNIVQEYGVVIQDKNITPHKMRGTYGTQLYNKTKDLYFVQEAMGHSNPKTTEIYIRGQKHDVAKKACELIGDLF